MPQVLLLDADTVPIVSLASTTSALLSQEVYLTDRVDNPARERMAHLKCLCFLRPSHESLSALEAELARPRYGSYYLFFTNILKRSAIERLAEADEHEVVREVQVRVETLVVAEPAGVLRGLRAVDAVALFAEPAADTAVLARAIPVRD